MKNAKLRISVLCERGQVVEFVEVPGRSNARTLRNLHAECSGKEDRRVGRNYRCQCACHKQQPPAARTAQEEERDRLEDEAAPYLVTLAEHLALRTEARW